MVQPFRKFRRWSKLGLLLLICLTFLSEGGLRAVGTIDFPTYDTDPQIGYVPRANQAGSFLNQKRWIINDRNMNVATPWQPFAQHDLLLTGDSLVWGGNSFDQPEKLGSAWSDEFYKDGIHPNPAGNVKLAELIAGHVQDKHP